MHRDRTRGGGASNLGLYPLINGDTPIWGLINGATGIETRLTRTPIWDGATGIETRVPSSNLTPNQQRGTGIEPGPPGSKPGSPAPQFGMAPPGSKPGSILDFDP